MKTSALHARNPLRGDGPCRGVSPPRRTPSGWGNREAARLGCRDPTRSCTPWTIWKTSGTCPRAIVLGSPKRSRNLLENPQPPVRAAAAAALGRLGQSESAAPLAGPASRPLEDRLAQPPPGRCGDSGTTERPRRHQANARRSRSPHAPRGHSRFRLSVLRNGRAARPRRAPDRALRRPRSVDAPPGAQDPAPVVLPHKRPSAVARGSSKPTWQGWPCPRPPWCART